MGRRSIKMELHEPARDLKEPPELKTRMTERKWDCCLGQWAAGGEGRILLPSLVCFKPPEISALKSYLWVLCLEYALLRHSLAHSFTPFRSFPRVTSMGTPPSILLKTSTAQPFLLHLHPYHSHCHYLCAFLIHNSSFLSGY